MVGPIYNLLNVHFYSVSNTDGGQNAPLTIQKYRDVKPVLYKNESRHEKICL